MITELAAKLNQAIKESDEYVRYQKTMEAVKKHPDLYQSMNTFRRRNYELQSYDDGVNRYAEIHNLSLEYEPTLRTPVVNDFLIAEQIFSLKLEEMYEIIAEGLNLDYDYME